MEKDEVTTEDLLPQAWFLCSVGVIPAYFLKTRLKATLLANPVSKAIPRIFWSPRRGSRRIFLASSTLKPLTKS